MGSSRPSLRHRGATYVIKNTDTHDDDNDIYHIIDEVYDETLQQSRWADFTATMYKYMDHVCTAFIIIAASIIALLGLLDNQHVIYNLTNPITGSTKNYSAMALTAIILGFSISALKSLLALFNLNQKSCLLKVSSIQLRKLSRQAKDLKNQSLTNDELLKRIDTIYTDIDDMDITMFSNGHQTTVTSNTTDVKVNVQPTTDV